MSVLRYKRTQSKAEYVNTAHKIYLDTLWFLSRLSARYGRLLSNGIIKLAFEVLDNCEKANSIYPSDDTRKTLRMQHLLEARGALMALDIHMADIYELFMNNPEGCFTSSSGKILDVSNAVNRIDKKAQSLGEKIDAENAMITSLLKSDKKR